MIDPVAPLHDQNSGSLRLFELLKAMRMAGHEVTFIARNAIGAGSYLDELRRMGIKAHGTDPERLAQLGHAAAEPLLDVPGIMAAGGFELAWLSFYDIAEQYLPLLRAHAPQAKVVIDTVDVHHVREQRAAELSGLPEVLHVTLRQPG